MKTKTKKLKGGVASYDNPSSYDPLIIGLNEQFPCNTSVINGFNPMDSKDTFNYQQSSIIGGNKKKRGGVAPYEKYNNMNDYMDTRYLNIGNGKTEWKPVDPGNMDFRQTNFALSIPTSTTKKTGGKSKKGGSSLFNNVSSQDLYTTTFLGNTNKYKALDVGNLETRGTNFALQLQKTNGGKKSKKGGSIYINNDIIIQRFIHKILLKSYQHYKKNNGGNLDISSGNNSSFLGNLLVNSLKDTSDPNSTSIGIFNNKYLGNDTKFTIKQPQKITGHVQSNFEF